MNIRQRETNFGVNIILLFISVIIIFVSWLLKVDYFIYQELDPVYFSLTNNEDKFNYFIKQEPSLDFNTIRVILMCNFLFFGSGILLNPLSTSIRSVLS